MRGTHPQLTLLLVALVIGAGALHALWNAIAKRAGDRLMAFALIGVASAAGGGLALALAGLPPAAAMPYVLTSAAIHVAYEIGLMNSYRLGAFNQAYPIARGTSPLVVAVGAFLLANERLRPVPLAGVVILAAGLMSLAASPGQRARLDKPAVTAAVLTGLTIAAYTIVDGLGVRIARAPYSYAGLLFLLQGLVLPAAAVLGYPAWRAPQTALAGPAAGGPARRLGWTGPRPRPARPAIVSGLLAGLLSLLAYGIVLWAQIRAPLAEVAAIRETSVIFAALIGMLAFQEPFGRRRVAAAAVIAAGIILIST